jgi:hypothetical protein
MNIRIKYGGALILCLLFNFVAQAASINFDDKSGTFKIGGASTLKIVSSPLTINAGTLKKSVTANIVGEVVFSNDNCLSRQSVTNNQLSKILLRGDDGYIGDPSAIINGIGVSNKRNRLEGSVVLNSPVTLQDLNTTLTLAIQNVFNQNIRLNNGFVALEDGFTFADDVCFTGSGKVNLHGHRLTFGGTPLSWPDPILWQNASDFELHSKMTVTGLWLFSGNAQITGNGNILDLTNGGSLWIKSGSTLYLADIKLKGLGTGRIVFESETSQLKLSQVEIEMDSNHTITIGGVYVEGPTTIVTKDKSFTLSTLGSMTVDGVSLYYDNGSLPFQLGILPSILSDPNSKFIARLNGGTIKNSANQELIKATSDALLRLTTNNSNALLFCCKNLSNSLLFDSKNLSNTILRLTTNNSNALLSGIKHNSDALLRLTANNSNALLFCCKNLSNSLLFDSKNLSNTILRLTTNNSNALLSGIKHNSDALLRLTANNSNALLFCCKNLSNSLLFDSKNLSNTILRLTANNSNALLSGIKHNSDALLRLTTNNSNALLFCCKNLSNSLLFDSKNLSNTILRLTANNSNALLSGIKHNSDALLRLTTNNSNALLFCCKNLSNSLLFVNKNLSNTILYFNKNLSNTILRLTTNNSNALLFCCKNLSNSLLSNNKNLSNAILRLTTNNSNALLFCCKNLSNSLLFVNKNLSNTILYLNKNLSNTILRLTSNNSNALLFCCKNLSNSLLFVNKNLSNTILYLNKNLSNTILYLHKNDSNAILWLDKQLQTIDHGPNDICVNTSTTNLRYDVYLSEDHKMQFKVDTVLNGSGHAIYFARKTADVMILDPGVNVILENVVLRNFDDASIEFGAGADILFGRNTKIELADCQSMSFPWRFAGNTIIYGDGNVLTLGAQDIGILQSGRLTLQDVILDGVADNNIRCIGDDASLMFKKSVLHLSDDFTFTAGSIQFVEEVILTGGKSFIYQTTRASTIASYATLILDKGMIFSYEPASANKDLLGMQDKTARIFLDGCTLNASTTGMRLQNGTLCIDHKNFLTNAGASSISEGFVFGSGVSINDLNIEIMPGATLELVSGILDYANVD